MKRKNIFSILLLSLAFFYSNALIYSTQNKELTSLKKDISAIERDLFELINQEREKLGLSSLGFSLDLRILARKHSQDMANRENISHLSSPGMTYTERLIEGGIFFKRNGENIAFSQTFLAKFIHQALMESPGHRENILTPEFDVVGIGVVFKENKGYYVTQDFIRSLVPREEEAKENIKKKINELRIENSLRPLLFLKEADEYAGRYTINKLKNRTPPPPPSHFGETQFIYITTPSLEQALSLLRDTILEEISDNAGLGIHFSRNKKNPGGSYFITLILLIENRYKSWSPIVLKDTISRAINEIKEKKGHVPLKQDETCSTYAENTAKKIFAYRNNSQEWIRQAILPKIPGIAVLYYITENPTQLPTRLKEKMENNLKKHTRIGIGILFGKSHEYPRGAFWVTIFLGE